MEPLRRHPALAEQLLTIERAYLDSDPKPLLNQPRELKARLATSQPRRWLALCPGVTHDA